MKLSIKSVVLSALPALLSALGVTPAQQRALLRACIRSVLFILMRLNFLVRFVAAVYFADLKRRKTIEGIPCIDGDLIDGRIDMQMARNGHYKLHADILALHKELGPVLQTFWRGQHVLLVNHPKLVKQVFDEAPDKIPQNMPLDTTLHRAKSDDRREELMKSLGPSLSSFKEKKVLLDRLCSVYDEHARNGTSFDPMEINGSFALDFLYGVLFRVDKNFMRFNFEAFKELRERTEFIFDNMEQALPNTRSASWLDFLLDAPALNIDKLMRRFDCWQHLQDHCKALLEEFRKKQYADNDYTFIPVFLNYAAEHKWKDEDMVRELAIFVLAGHETTANAMSWLMFELARNDGVQEKCREVVRAPKDSKGNPIVPGMRSPNSYLLRVIKESMRLNPVVSRPMLRVSEKDIVMELPSGQTVTIPAGTGFLVNLYALHNSEANWENPTVFDPDRFCSTDPDDFLRFIPFSFGSRKCIGESMALKEMLMVLEVLAKYHFSFEDANMKTQDRRELQRSSITMRPVDGLRMRVTKPAAPAPIAPIDN